MAKRSYFNISAVFVDSHSHLFSMRGSGSRARPDGLDRRERPSGALESAIAVSRARVRKGDVSRPERSGGRVTATQRQSGSPMGADGSGCESPDGAARSAAPRAIATAREGGGISVAAVHKAGEERRFGATPATATPLTSFMFCADERSVRRTRSRPRKGPRPGSRSEAKSAGPRAKRR